MPSIAVVIPAYNSEKTIEKAILSVLAQTSPVQEVIVVDDGSADGTASLVEEHFKCVSLIRQGNQGAAVARQTGTLAAVADYVAYLDSDDWWPENKIERCKAIIAVKDIDFMLGDLQRAWPDDGPAEYLPRNSSFFPWARRYFEGRPSRSSIENLYRLEPEDGLSLLLEGFPVYPSTVVVRRRAVKAVGGWDSRFRRCQDFDIGLRLARRFPLHYLDEVQAIVGLHGGNDDDACAYYKYVVRQTEGDIRVLLAHLEDEPPRTQYHCQVTKALGRKYCGLGYVHRGIGNYKLARQSYAKAIKVSGCRTHALIRWALLFRPLLSIFQYANSRLNQNQC